MTLVIGLVLSTCAVTLWRVGAATPIGSGYDLFTTPSNGQTGEELSLDQGFFTNRLGSPSKAFRGKVAFKGGDPVPGFPSDTVIERTDDIPDVPGDTRLLVVGLRLVGVGTILINFADGTQAKYSVSVKESPSVASTGSMHFNADGTFSSSLQINREYTFTSADQDTRVFDAGSGDGQFSAWPAIRLSANGSWEPSGNRSFPGTETHAAVPTGGVIVRPNTEQARLAAHGIFPTPRPTPTKIEIDPIFIVPSNNNGR